jgi:hypothetical protein
VTLLGNYKYNEALRGEVKPMHLHVIWSSLSSIHARSFRLANLANVELCDLTRSLTEINFIQLSVVATEHMLGSTVDSATMVSSIAAESFSSSSSADNKVRIEDYLNDKLQTSADLDNLDSLLEDVRKQQDLLRKQVSLRLGPTHHTNSSAVTGSRDGPGQRTASSGGSYFLGHDPSQSFPETAKRD